MLHAALNASFDESKKNMPPSFTPPAKERVPPAAGASGPGRAFDPSGVMRFRTEEARRLLPRQRMAHGNQATLRLLGKSAQPVSQGEGKCGCGGGGGGCACKEKGQSALSRGAADRV